MIAITTRLTVVGLLSLTLCLGAATAAAQGGEKVLTVPFPAVGDVCLDGPDRAALIEQMKKLVVPPGSAVTLVSFSDQTEATRKRPGLTSNCIAHLVPEGIKAHQRIAVFRALLVAEIGLEIGIDAFGADPILVIGTDASYRQQDPQGMAVIASRSEGNDPEDRRVEVWVTPGRAGGSTGSGTVVLTPILLPPPAYAGGASPGGPLTARTTTVMQIDGTVQEAWGWTMVGLGLTSFVGAGFSFAQANDKKDKARRVEFDTERALELQDDADFLGQLGGWTAGLGVGLTTLGILLVAMAPETFRPDAEASEMPAVRFAATPKGGAVLLGLDF